ncbi:MAG: hypothetical protein IKA09_04785 [Lachnospiraceae bacterium]|nr:hypothetical protein [Lachnospiraceae bacterium]
MKHLKQKLYTSKQKLYQTLTDETGDFYISDAVKIIIAVVLGSLVLAALTAIFNDTVIPSVTQKIQQMFQ